MLDALPSVRIVAVPWLQGTTQSPQIPLYCDNSSTPRRHSGKDLQMSGFQSHKLPLAMRQHINGICEEFEAAWQNNQQPRITDYLANFEGEARLELVRRLVELDLDYRRTLGEPVSTKTFFDEYPQLGKELTRALEPRKPTSPRESASAKTIGRRRGQNNRETSRQITRIANSLSPMQRIHGGRGRRQVNGHRMFFLWE